MADMLYQPPINQDIAYDYHVFPQLIEGAPGALFSVLESALFTLSVLLLLRKAWLTSLASLCFFCFPHSKSFTALFFENGFLW